MKLKYLLKNLTTDKYSLQTLSLRSWYVLTAAIFNVVYYFLFDRTHETDPATQQQMLIARITVFAGLSVVAVGMNINPFKKHPQWAIFPAGVIVGVGILYLMQLGSPSDAYHNTYLPEMILVLCIAPLVGELTPFIASLQIIIFLLVYNLFVGTKLSTANKHWMINANLVMGICIFYVILLRIYLQKLSATNKRSQMQVEKEKIRIARKNAELLDMDALKSKILSVLGHDVRTPLANILNMMSLKQYMTPEEHAALTEAIKDSTKHTLDLLNNLLDWSAAQMKGIQINTSTVPVYKISSNVMQLSQPAANAKGLILYNLIPQNIVIHTDPFILQLLLRNLVSNAIKFTRTGSVTVGCSMLADGIEVQVSDTGVGIGNHTDIFDFRQIRNSVGTNNEKGSGFGLMLCREYLSRLGGRLYYKGKETGGTTFYIYLPFAQVHQPINEKAAIN